MRVLVNRTCRRFVEDERNGRGTSSWRTRTRNGEECASKVLFYYRYASSSGYSINGEVTARSQLPPSLPKLRPLLLFLISIPEMISLPKHPPESGV